MYDCIVIGGGAAGLMCAATAGSRGKKTLVLDHANKVGKKILMSGGGRCNFTNLDITPDNYLCTNQHFCKSALSRYTQYDFLALVDQYQLAYHEKTKGQLFCDDKAKDILNILLNECKQANANIITECSIDKIDRKDEHFHLTTSTGTYQTQALVIATGGLSIPTMGATGFGYDVAKQFGLKSKPKQAALVPYTFKGEWLEVVQQLSGVSLEVGVTCNNTHFREALLFTHRGLSGPAILQITNYWHPGDKLHIDFAPELDLETLIKTAREQGSKTELKNLLAQNLPKRFVQLWLASCPLQTSAQGANKPVNQYSNKEISTLVQWFKQWAIVPAGTEGYKTAEVTRGGVDTDEISSKTFECKNVPGLYFVGEVLDVTGWLGGFNFQWAWASGYCAGMSL